MPGVSRLRRLVADHARLGVSDGVALAGEFSETTESLSQPVSSAVPSDSVVMVILLWLLSMQYLVAAQTPGTRLGREWVNRGLCQEAARFHGPAQADFLL